MKQRGSNGVHLNNSKKIACCRSQSDAAHYKFLSDCHSRKMINIFIMNL